MNVLLPCFLLPLLFACSDGEAQQQQGCDQVPEAFVAYVSRTLTDTTGRFATDYPKPTPLTCELLLGLDSAFKNDSVRYHFDHLHQRYGDPRAGAAFTYIRRHNDFHLEMALTTHWNPDTRVEAVRAVQNYRKMRPLVCTTREGSTALEEQDRQGVRYFIRVLETTPMGIAGSENATIHSIYMREVMKTLDLFTGQDHRTSDAMDLRLNRSEASVQQAIQDWRKWLAR